MFNQIARRYDFLNRFLSAGIDIFWRKKAIGLLAGRPPATVLDVATGTGDMAIMLAKRYPSAQVTGIDISEGMLDFGRRKIAKAKLNDRVSLRGGDSEAINFPEASFDAVTVAFGVRNFQSLEQGLKEMRRVLKPGGKLVILEFSRPGNSFFLPFYKVYLRYVAPGIGKMISGNGHAYQYLNDSVNAFPEGPAMLEILEKTGFVHSYQKKLSLGICSIYCGNQNDFSASPPLAR
jgi:demethylmenaquinone methyltransferase/2-methoxy-6-polyprenyl-1,4-benzoquinol methylase